LAVALCLAPACDEGADGPPGSGGLGVAVHALNTEACSGANGNGAPLSEISQVTVVVSGIDPATGEYDPQLVNDTRNLNGNRQLTIRDVDEGSGHKLELFGATDDGAITWYAMDPNVDVLRNENNAVDLLLTRYGGFLCASADENSYTNVVFPAVAELGDGRMMALGGFTQIVTVDANTYLGGPSSQGIIFDPKTGEVSVPFDMGVDNARGAHALVFIPSVDGSTSGQVLVIGGMSRLRMDTKRAFPFVLGNDKSDVLNDVLLYDIDANQFTELPGEIMDAKRAFPRAALMSDGTVVITGGGGWPNETADAYRAVEIFDPNREEGPGFLPIVSFEGEVARSGHTLTFLKNDENGQSHFLLWGGTSNLPEAAEVLRQSSLQGDGVDGSFAAVAEGGSTDEVAFSTYFHELTPLDENRFLLTGGLTANGDSLGLARQDEAWVLTYSEEPTPGLMILRAPGFGQGRVFHTAASSDGRHVSVIGGFASAECGDDCSGYTFPTIGSGSIRFFDLEDGSWSDAPEGDAFTHRGGMGGLMMRNGSVFLAGGEPDLSAFTSATSRAIVEVYTPSNIPQP